MGSVGTTSKDAAASLQTTWNKIDMY